ncbi:hypothetical protein GCM10010282_32900 [Streptomyces roseolus]|nr:hypothetical protein GCM10010282_32900 [Streptomyces roseolus]
MDRALADGDRDVLVGDDAGEALGDAVEFHGRGAGRVDDALSLAERSGSGGQGGAKLSCQCDIYTRSAAEK